MFAQGSAWPPNTMLTSCWRGVAYSNASFRVVFRSSRFLGFLRVGVEPEVGDLAAVLGHHGRVRRVLECVGDGVRHLVDEVEIALLEGGDHRGRVGVVGHRHRFGVRFGAVEVGVGLEHGGAFFLELGDRVRPARHGRQVLVGEVRLAAPCRCSPVYLSHTCLGRMNSCSRLASTGHRLAVGDHQRVGIGRFGLLDSQQRACVVGGGTGLVLERGLDRPHGVGGGQRHLVRPLAAGDQVECPGQPVGAGCPALRPVALELQPRAVLHQLGVFHDEGVIGLGVDRRERVERVDVVGAADLQDVARPGSGGCAATAAARGDRKCQPKHQPGQGAPWGRPGGALEHRR